MTNKTEQEEIYLVLDAALNELDDDDEEGDESSPNASKDATTATKLHANNDDASSGTAETCSPTKTQPPQSKKDAPIVIGPPRPPAPSEGDSEKMIGDMMQEMLRMQQTGSGDAQEDEFLGQLMQDLQSQLGSDLSGLATNAASPQQKSKSPAKKSKSKPKELVSSPSEGSGVDGAISSLLEGMAKEKLSDDAINGSDPSMMGETDILENLMKGLGGNGGLNPDAAIDGIMEQLMSKDLMYEPIKQFATSFPPWLEERKEEMSKEEYSRRRKQCECFRRIVHVYDTEPGNTAKIMDLMQENQE